MSNLGSDTFWITSLPDIKKMLLAATATFFTTSCLISGQPPLAGLPGVAGHLSSSSLSPSPSVSGMGQPLYFAVPATAGHLSSSSLMPSPSVSGIGQPLYLAVPATSGHLSFLSAMPSLSLSGQPANVTSPATSGH